MYREISKEELIKAMKLAKSRRQTITNLNLPQTGTANKFVRELIQKYGINEKEYYNGKKNDCLLSKFSKEEIQQAINNSTTYKEVLERLGYNNVAGSAYRTLKNHIIELELDVSNLTHRATNPFTPNTDEQVFCEHSQVTQSCLRNRVLKKNLIPYVCAICGQPPEWNGKPLTLTLDHKNGNRTDNRLENLQFVCPNCDHQQSTFCSKNKQRYYNL